MVVAFANRHLFGMPIAAAGMLFNLAAILANGGHMPALPSAMRDGGLSFSGVHNNSVREASPNLAWFVDRWAAPSWVPFGNIFSVGDVLIAVGAIVVIAAAMGARRAVPAHAGGRDRPGLGVGAAEARDEVDVLLAVVTAASW